MTPKPKRGYLVQAVDLVLDPPASIANLVVDVEHLWVVPEILGVRPLLFARVTLVPDDPGDPAEQRAHIAAVVDAMRQSPAAALPIILDIAGKDAAMERGRVLSRLLPGSELQEMSEGVMVGYPGEVDPIVFLRTARPSPAGLH
jgi:hypothetical protein